MKTLTLTEKDLAPVLSAPNYVSHVVIDAIIRYCFYDEEPQFEDRLCHYIFEMVRPSFDAKKKMSRGGSARKNAGNKHASKEYRIEKEIKGQSKPNQRSIKGQSKVTEIDDKKNTSTDTCEASKSKVNQSLPKIGVKETENKEEDTPSPSNLPQTLSFTSTPIEEEKKDKEKKEMQKKVDIDEEKEISFYEQMKEHYPRVMSMRQPLTWKQYLKMTTEDGFSARLIKSILEEMENYVLLTTKYVSASLTIRSWIKRRGR